MGYEWAFSKFGVWREWLRETEQTNKNCENGQRAGVMDILWIEKEMREKNKMGQCVDFPEAKTNSWHGSHWY